MTEIHRTENILPLVPISLQEKSFNCYVSYKYIRQFKTVYEKNHSRFSIVTDYSKSLNRIDVITLIRKMYILSFSNDCYCSILIILLSR